MVRLRGVTANRLPHANFSRYPCWSVGSGIGPVSAIAMRQSAHF